MKLGTKNTLFAAFLALVCSTVLLFNTLYSFVSFSWMGLTVFPWVTRLAGFFHQEVIRSTQPIVFPGQEKEGDRVVFGGTYTLIEGEKLGGDLVIMGGSVTLEASSIVEGGILLMGGSLRSNGQVEGDILAFGGQIELGDEALVEGSVNMLGGNLDRAPGSRIEGDENFGLAGPVLPVIPGSIQRPELRLGINPFWRMFWILVRSFLWAAVAVLVTLFLPAQSRRVSQVAIHQPLIAGGLGLLTVIVAPVILILVAITIIGIPVSLLAALVLFVAWCFGNLAIGLEVGRRLSTALNQEWALPVSAALGVFILTLVTNSIDLVISCVGWLLPALVGVLGLGAVLLTRFGTHAYPPVAIPENTQFNEPGSQTEPDDGATIQD